MEAAWILTDPFKILLRFLAICAKITPRGNREA